MLFEAIEINGEVGSRAAEVRNRVDSSDDVLVVAVHDRVALGYFRSFGQIEHVRA